MEKVEDLYKKYQLDTINSDIKNKNFFYEDNLIKVEVDEDLKLVTIFDINGNVIVDGKLIESIPCVNKNKLGNISFNDNNRYLMIQYKRKIDNEICIGIFDKNTGFMLVDDIREFYVKTDNKKSFFGFLKSFSNKNSDDGKESMVLDSSLLLDFLSNFHSFSNCLCYFGNEYINVYSIYDRKNVIKIHKDNIPGNIESLYAFPNKILGNFSSESMIKSFSYDIETEKCEFLDPIYIQKIDGNLIYSGASKVYLFDDRTGIIVNVSDDISSVKQGANKLVRLRTPILSLEEFKEVNNIFDEEKRRETLHSKINTKIYYFEEEKKKFENAAKKRKLELKRTLNRIELLLEDKKTRDMADQFLHTVPIDKKDLLEIVNDHYEIVPMYRNMLKFFDLSGICFENTKVSDINFNGTNASIDPQVVYNHDVSNSKFNEFSFTPFTDFSNVLAYGTDFTNCNNFINLNGAIVDEKTKMPAIEGPKKRRF